MKLLRVLIGVFALSGIALGIAWAASEPEGLPGGSESASRLAAGPYAVGLEELRWVDDTRPTAANGDFAGAPERSFAVALWYPVAAPGRHPLVVYSHGFMSDRHGGQYLAEHLASHGYLVVSTDYPLTSFGAPGGPNVADAVNQPGDVSFLIDSVLGLGAHERPFAGEVDETRIGVFGLSLGGLTTTLVAFHPELRDPRVRAAISIAGPTVMFGPRYFRNADVPLLMIAGTSDAMIDFQSNAVRLPGLVREGGLIAIEGGTHAGFSARAAGVMRVLGNPDRLGCTMMLQNLDIAPEENPFEGLGSEAQGFIDATDALLPCAQQFETAMAAGRQHLLTTLAVRAFFESLFTGSASERAAHAEYLSSTLPRELAEVAFTQAERS
jgi:predicted dienelactone hydrolase